MLNKDDIRPEPLGQAFPKRIFRYKIRHGDDGIRDTLVLLAWLHDEFRAHPELHKLVWGLVSPFAASDHRNRAKAIYEYTQGFNVDRTRGRFPGLRNGLLWRPDPDGVELIYDPILIIQNGGGDCEELELLLGLLLTIAGYRTQHVIISTATGGELHHIMGRIPVDDARALYLDPSERAPMGFVTAGIKRAWIASTSLNSKGTVDITEVPPETIRGEGTFGNSQALETGGPSMSPVVIAPSIMGSLAGNLGSLSGGFSLMRKLDNEGPRVTGVSRLEADFKKDIDGIVGWLNLNASKFPGGIAKYTNPLNRARSRIREIVNKWINDSDVTDDAAKTAMRSETKKGPNGYLQVWVDAQAESNLTFALPSEGGSGLKLPGDLDPAQIQKLQQQVSQYSGGGGGGGGQPTTPTDTGIPNVSFDPNTGRITTGPAQPQGMSWATIAAIAAAIGVPVVMLLAWLLKGRSTPIIIRQ